ncbi:three-helix bundle dimerization domain-containing protein [Microbacterium testaceum]|uniref:three-helix bundle dimerization domain-containing protein n=1 Tax=Microbacterium testaceum TaxID=2033 RepID=UPI0035941BC4
MQSKLDDIAHSLESQYPGFSSQQVCDAVAEAHSSLKRTRGDEFVTYRIEREARMRLERPAL